MPQLIACPACNATLEIETRADLALLRCPQCGARLGRSKARGSRRRRSRTINWPLFVGVAAVTLLALGGVYWAIVPPDPNRRTFDRAPATAMGADQQRRPPAGRGSEPGVPGGPAAPGEPVHLAVADTGEFNRRRAAFKTKLIKRGPAPQRFESDFELPLGVRKFPYLSAGRELKAWLYLPDGGATANRPALVFLHGGYAFAMDDMECTQPFMDKGYVVYTPTYRGENGNSGDFEMFLGEVDDARAAIKFLASQKYVDPKRIYVLGHSAGGAIAANLSLLDDVPAVHTASVGGLYAPSVSFVFAAEAPFRFGDETEKGFRTLFGNIRHMQRRHIAYIGKGDVFVVPAFHAADAELAASQRKLSMVSVPGDHQESLEHGMQEYLKLIESETK
jgi:acetyl esterase/lipase